MTTVDLFAIKEKIVEILKADTTNLWDSTPSDKTKFRKIESGSPSPKAIQEPPLPRLWVTSDETVALVKPLGVIESNASKGEEYDIRLKIIFVVEAKDGSGRIVLRAASKGTGIIAGGPVRAVCEVLGVKDIVAKSMGTSNAHNVIRATMKALLKQNSPKQISTIRNKKISEIIEKRG